MPASTVDLESFTNPSERATSSILIVEDEVIVAEDVRRRLEEMGYHISGVVSRGDHALREVRSHRPDLILMDIGLKGTVDGIETAKSILDEEDIPIVFASAYSDDATLRRAKAIDPFGFVLKPFDERELRTAIEIALYKHAAEQKLRARETMYRTLVELSTDGIATIDLSGRITFCNMKKVQMHGYTSPDELIGRQASEFVQAAPPGEGCVQLDQVLGGPTLTDERITLLRKDGTPIIVEISTTLIRGVPGTPTQVMTIEHDISHRVQLAEELQASTCQVNFMAEQLHDAFMSEDTAGHIRVVNSAFSRMFGIDGANVSKGVAVEVLERAMGALMPDGGAYPARTEAIRAKGEPVHGDVLRLRDGRLVTRDYAPLFADGTLLGHVWLFRAMP